MPNDLSDNFHHTSEFIFSIFSHNIFCDVHETRTGNFNLINVGNKKGKKVKVQDLVKR